MARRGGGPAPVRLALPGAGDSDPARFLDRLVTSFRLLIRGSGIPCARARGSGTEPGGRGGASVAGEDRDAAAGPASSCRTTTASSRAPGPRAGGEHRRRTAAHHPDRHRHPFGPPAAAGRVRAVGSMVERRIPIGISTNRNRGPPRSSSVTFGPGTSPTWARTRRGPAGIYLAAQSMRTEPRSIRLRRHLRRLAPSRSRLPVEAVFRSQPRATSGSSCTRRSWTGCAAAVRRGARIRRVAGHARRAGTFEPVRRPPR